MFRRGAFLWRTLLNAEPASLSAQRTLAQQTAAGSPNAAAAASTADWQPAETIYALSTAPGEDTHRLLISFDLRTNT